MIMHKQSPSCDCVHCRLGRGQEPLQRRVRKVTRTRKIYVVIDIDRNEAIAAYTSLRRANKRHAKERESSRPIFVVSCFLYEYPAPRRD